MLLVVDTAKFRQNVPIVPIIINTKISFFVLYVIFLILSLFEKRYRITLIEKTTASSMEQNNNMPSLFMYGMNKKAEDQKKRDKKV